MPAVRPERRDHHARMQPVLHALREPASITGRPASDALRPIDRGWHGRCAAQLADSIVAHFFGGRSHADDAIQIFRHRGMRREGEARVLDRKSEEEQRDSLRHQLVVLPWRPLQVQIPRALMEGDEHNP